MSDENLREAAARRVIIFVRQSEYIQESSGGRDLQIEACLEHARLLGIAVSEVQVIAAWGERGGARARRAKFESMLALIRHGLVGVIIVPDHHRLSRNLRDAEALFHEAAERGVLLHIGGRAYNPANPSDRYILEVLAGHAQYENATRSRWHLGAKLKKAESCRTAIRLPNGLVWVSLDDPKYWTLAANIGLGAWTTTRTTHRTNVPAFRRSRRVSNAKAETDTRDSKRDDDSGPRKVVMPFPDADLVRALVLILRWILRDGSVEKVAERIHAGEEHYPNPKHVPVVLGGQDYSAELTVEWRKVGPNQLAQWITSPALFGIYSVYMEALVPASKRRTRETKGRKGMHYARAVSRRRPLLPSAAALLDNADALRALADLSVLVPPMPAAGEESPHCVADLLSMPASDHSQEA